MVDKIYAIKNKILERLDKDVSERGVERLDPQMVDMVKDLAEAEMACWKADYYRSVVEAMEGSQDQDASGYQGGGGRGGSGGGRSGWRNQYGSGRNRSGRRGYGDYHGALEEMRSYMQGAEPEERERMRAEIRSMMDGQM